MLNDTQIFQWNKTYIYFRQECEDQGGTDSGSCADGKMKYNHMLLGPNAF